MGKPHGQDTLRKNKKKKTLVYRGCFNPYVGTMTFSAARSITPRGSHDRYVLVY